MGAEGKVVGASKVARDISSASGSRRNFLFSVARQDAELIAEFREHVRTLRAGVTMELKLLLPPCASDRSTVTDSPGDSEALPTNRRKTGT
jgi:hypothetical protein